MELSFYDHHRQSYGHMPIREERAEAEFMIGDYGDGKSGVHEGGEFAIHLIRLGGQSPFADSYLAPRLAVYHDAAGSLQAFLDTGALDVIHAKAKDKEIRHRDTFTALLIASGLQDRSDHPVGHEPKCDCCGQAVRGGALLTTQEPRDA